MKIKITILFLFTTLSCFSKNPTFTLHIKSAAHFFRDDTCYFMELECNEKKIVKIVSKSDIVINLNPIVASPSDVVLIHYYRSIKKKNIEKIRALNDDLKFYSSKQFSFIMPDSIVTILLKKDTILLLSPKSIERIKNKFDDDLYTLLKTYSGIGDSLHRLYSKASSLKEKDDIHHLNDSLFTTLVGRKNLDSVIMPAIKANLTNLFSLYAIKEYVRQSKVYGYSLPKKTLLEMLHKMRSTQKRFTAWIDLNNVISTLPDSANYKSNNISKDLINQPAPSFEKLEDPTGHPIKLEDYRGKVVFIDFWASWCEPCAQQIPELKRVYDQYKEKEIVFVSISLDTNREKWKKAIFHTDLTWFNASDLKGILGVTTSKYKVFVVPQNYLINKNGIIIDENISMKNLSNKIKEALQNE